ncbi:glycosyltransferase family 2 protein [Paenibacillus crassostreae]|uniref:Glycosyl transferase family A n=1 Tax=Paenibacillus crassostreae TaxID=1763538 RepID=A0A167GCX8_9BACL|nr:glycosyltransferase family 2 protein [Paenibacillus crassostreae]AOZ92683.1 glycosyl transferase family A [Paenibacillus crassostreae]OAB77454.1 glycosyl transferase family A [Paenibacillus crassostreae]
MKISVIVPSYQRVDALLNCLEGIQKQTRYPDEIIVVVRNTDDSTLQYLSSIHMENLKIALIEQSGVIAALNLGIKESIGSIVVLTDDDTVSHSNWLEKIENYYVTNPDIGGVGGRDIVHFRGKPVEAIKQQVGIIKPYGRIIGNHHIGLGSTREVDILKGANMSFRKDAIRGMEFDEKLKGTGAQIYNEMEFSLSVKQKGWKLIYDPKVCVDHYPAERFDEDQRNSFNEIAFFNMAHNETYTLLKHSNWKRRLLYIGWVILIGSKSSPGVVQFMRMLPKEKYNSFKKILISYKGRWGGWKTWRGSLE